MIKLNRLIKESLKNDNFGKKFIGDSEEFVIYDSEKDIIKEDNSNKIEVINKKTKNRYLVTKSYYEKHKDNYDEVDIFVNRPVKKIRSPKKEVEEQINYPESIQQFKKNIILNSSLLKIKIKDQIKKR